MKSKWSSLLLLVAGFAAHAQTNVAQLEEGAQTKFAIIGDYGNDSSDEKKVAALVSKSNPDFVLTLGDNNYTNGCWETIDKNIGQYYSEFIGDYKGKYGRGAKENKFFASLGNHDWNAVGKCMYKGELPYLSYFTLPGNGRYYDFKKGNVHFFAIDSDSHEPDGNKKGSKQYEWLKNKVKESDACFKVVFFHHPPYSSGDHGSNKDTQWKFDELGIDVVLSGHDHGYERIKRDGIVYFVNGAGGAGLYDFDKKVDGSEYRYNKKHGYMMGYARDNRLAFAFYNDKNKIKDSITITKDCG